MTDELFEELKDKDDEVRGKKTSNEPNKVIKKRPTRRQTVASISMDTTGSHEKTAEQRPASPMTIKAE